MCWRILILLLSCLFTSSAKAAEPSPRNTVAIAIGVTYRMPLLINDDDSVIGLPVTNQVGVRWSHTLGRSWIWMVEPDMSTPFAEFVPSLVLSTGPAKRVTARVLVGASLIWRITPRYQVYLEPDLPASQGVGIGLAPMIRLDDWGALALPVSVTCDHETWSNRLCLPYLSVGVKVLPKISAW